MEVNLGPGPPYCFCQHNYCYSTKWVLSILVCWILLSLGRGRVGKGEKIGALEKGCLSS